MGIFDGLFGGSSGSTPQPSVREMRCFACDGTGEQQEELFVDPGGDRPSVPYLTTYIKTYKCPECRGRGTR